VDCVRGPNDDWIDEAAHTRWFGEGWALSARSNRIGFRLDGPGWTFTDRATHKPRESGDDPSNIIEQGYPVGGVNLGGQTPIILMNDCLTLGGFINPYTVPHGEFWKLGQAKPGDLLRFREVDVAAAQAQRRVIDRHCTPEAIATT